MENETKVTIPPIPQTLVFERVLEHARQTGKRVRIFLGNRETGEVWQEENDVSGYVSRSMGPNKIYILKPQQHSMGGPGILVDCIVRIIVQGGPDVRIPNLAMPTYKSEGLNVTVNDQPYATLKSEVSAARLAAFMAGQRFTK